MAALTSKRFDQAFTSLLASCFRINTFEFACQHLCMFLFVYIMTLRWPGFGLEAGLPRKSANTYGGKAVVFSSIVLDLTLDWLVLFASCLAPSGCGFEAE